MYGDCFWIHTLSILDVLWSSKFESLNNELQGSGAAKTQDKEDQSEKTESQTGEKKNWRQRGKQEPMWRQRGKQDQTAAFRKKEVYQAEQRTRRQAQAARVITTRNGDGSSHAWTEKKKVPIRRGRTSIEAPQAEQHNHLVSIANKVTVPEKPAVSRSNKKLFLPVQYQLKKTSVLSLARPQD